MMFRKPVRSEFWAYYSLQENESPTTSYLMEADLEGVLTMVLIYIYLLQAQ